MITEDGARIFLFQMVAAGADRGYRSLDNFVSWFVGGTAALFGLLIGNLDKVNPYISIDELRAIIPRIICAFGLVLFAKFLGSLICTRAGALERALEVSKAWQDRGWDLPNQQQFTDAQAEVLPTPLKLIFKILPPSVAAQANRTLWWLMIAGLSSLVAAGLVISAWIELAAAL